MEEHNLNAPKIIALVPMRHSSERVPGKNYRLLAGKPLYAHVIEALLGCPEISGVVVDTDSPVMMQGLRERYPRVTVLERPHNLRDGMIPMNEILLYDTAQVEADYYLQTHSTNPLLRSETISRAVQTFLSQREQYDSLFSVTRLQTRLYWQDGSAVNHNPGELLRTQDLPPIFEENSCIYLFTREKLAARNHRLGDAPLMFEIDAAEAWDIDEELDFQIADFLMQQRTTS
ncbi:MAG TPA: acylneuraminate cytidylyltransferase family protein [Anaerolineales bacterium]|jgi:CMP-N-acetylneuraminic acid synthetase|nr:acylneuraminate cytidylyltransferase family protein [Anaerolineales bacterium]